MNSTSTFHDASLEAPRSVQATIRESMSARIAGLPSWVVVTQLFIGLGWLRAAGEKIIDPSWWTGDVILDFVASHSGQTLGWYQPFIDLIVVPGATGIAVVVVAAQLVAGLTLISGRRMTLGLGVGMFLNMHFLAAGAVTPSAFYLLAQGALVLWLVERRPTIQTERRLEIAAYLAIIIAAASVPSISTLHPAHVIDDPAAMYVFGGTLAVLACLVAFTAKEPNPVPVP